MPSLSPSERIGTTVAGRYEIRRLLGEGGFSAVFEAVHNVTGREVALKLLHPHLVTTEQITERFLMEARAMARIRHDGIVQVLDAGTDPDGTVYIALELLNGESLETTLSRVRKLTWGETVAIGIDLLGALAEAHRNKIIHRDIKPGNIYIVRKQDGSSQAKLLDFGIAHVTQRGQKLTQQGMILGTPEYMSPEQSRGTNIGPESDLWSLGIVLFECLVSQTPFASETTTDILVKIATTNAPSVASLEPSVPRSVSAVIDRSLLREIEPRFHSAEEMAKALEDARDEADSARVSKAPTPTRVANVTTPRRPPPETLSASAEERVVADGPVPKAEIVPGNLRGGNSREKPISLAASLRRPTPALGQSVGVMRPGGAGAVRVVEVDATRSREEPVSRGSGAVRREALAAAANAALAADRNSATTTNPGDSGRISPVPSTGVPSLPPAASFDLDLPPVTPTSIAGERISGDRLSGEGFGRVTVDRPAPRSFQTPPTPSNGRSPVVTVLAVVGALAVAGAVAFKLVGEGTPGPTTPNTPVGPGRATNDRADGGGPSTIPAANLEQLRTFNPGPGLAGTDALSDFARHAAVSGPSGAQRIVVSCLPGGEAGPTVVIHPLSGGPTLGSFRGVVACAGFDLGVVPDVTDDGTDDVVATTANATGIVVIDARSLRVWRTIAVPGARGIALGGGYTIGGSEGDVVTVVYTEPNGPGEPSEVRAISLRRQRVLWSVNGSNTLGRIGQPVELGLAVGPDATGDQVPDVVMGIGPMGNSAAGGDRRRCVQLYSGASGAPVWSEPFCRPVGRSAQSLSLGYDVNGDGRGDVAVGTDQHDVAAPVLILSGVNGSTLLTVTPPASEQGTAFGWPVALSGDLNGNDTPDLVVGTTGRQTLLTLFDARSGEVGGRLTLSGDGAGNLRVFPVQPNSPSEPWSLLVADPGNGLRLMARRGGTEPL